MPDVCRCQLRILTTLKNGGNGNTIRAAFENQTAKTGPLWLRRKAQFSVQKVEGIIDKEFRGGW